MGTSRSAGRKVPTHEESSNLVGPLRPALTARALTSLLAALEPSPGRRPSTDSALDGVVVSGLSLNSKLVHPGDLYVGLAGAKTHGAVYAEQAVRSGAVAVLTDAEGAERLRPDGPEASTIPPSKIPASKISVPVITVDDPRATMAELAAELYGHPASSLAMCAITGTNGKTTTAYLLEAALAAAGREPGLIGTIGYRVKGETLVGERTTVTTPESPDLQALLALMLERGADAVAMEVSSHAMALRRTEPVLFDVAAFTNLGRDHLDFHLDMAHYFEAKASLFTPAHARAAVVNVDAEWGQRLARRVREPEDGGEGKRLPLITTGRSAAANFRLVEARRNPDQSQDLIITTPSGELRTTLGLPGDYNADNAVTALAMISAIGLDPFEAQAGLRGVQVPGRMQRLALPEGSPSVIVDFAHTPQAIASVLSALGTGSNEPGRVIAVLGAGGDRDAAKRGQMGAEAARGADIVVVTDDNPRSEDPAAIRSAVFAGASEAVEAGANARVIDGGDRRAALRLALDLAENGDVIAVLGKGHETGQEVAGEILEFSDVDVVSALAGGSDSNRAIAQPEVGR